MAQDNVIIKFDLQLSPESKSTLDQLRALGSIDEATAQQFAETNAALQKRDEIIDSTTASMQNLSKAAADVSKNIVTGAAEDQIKKLNTATDQATEKTVRLSTQVRAMRNELAQMEQAGLGGTAAFEKLSIQAAKLEDQVGDTSKRIRALASDTKNIDAVVGAVSGLASAFSVAQGAAALLGGENQDLQKALLKVQAAMAVANGVQQIANLLQKESAVVLAARRLQLAATATVTGLYSGATSLATIATAAWNRVLALNPIVAIATALTLAVTAVYQFVKSTDDSTESLKKQNAELARQKKLVEDSSAAFYAAIKRSNEVVNTGNENIINNLETQIKLAKIRGATLTEVFGLEKNLIDSRLTLLKNSGNSDTAEFNKLVNDKRVLAAQYYKDIEALARKSNEDLKAIPTGGADSVGTTVSAIPEAISAAEVERFKTNLAEQGKQARLKIRQDESLEQVALDQQLKQELLNTSIQFGNQLFAFGAALNAQQQDNLKQRLDSGRISEQKYAKEIAELKRKQAVADKEAAAFNIVINTAIAISKVAAQTGILATVLSVAIGALGAAQLATVLAQPIPAFKKGTKKAPAGFKVVGEDGPELLYDKGGYQIFNAGDTKQFFENPFAFPEMLPHIPDEVLTQYITNRSGEQVDYNSLGKSIAKHIGAEIERHPKVAVNIDERGFQKHMDEGLSRRKYWDDKFTWNG
ncbi:MAG: hypothetical protein KA821_19220 [Chitinophagaceae bacterium]|nr:hypothetical protein [Chitinophagaceae bacterium]